MAYIHNLNKKLESLSNKELANVIEHKKIGSDVLSEKQVNYARDIFKEKYSVKATEPSLKNKEEYYLKKYKVKKLVERANKFYKNFVPQPYINLTAINYVEYHDYFLCEKYKVTLKMLTDKLYQITSILNQTYIDINMFIVNMSSETTELLKNLAKIENDLTERYDILCMYLSRCYSDEFIFMEHKVDQSKYDKELDRLYKQVKKII